MARSYRGIDENRMSGGYEDSAFSPCGPRASSAGLRKAMMFSVLISLRVNLKSASPRFA